MSNPRKVLIVLESVSINGVAKTVLNLCEIMCRSNSRDSDASFEVNVAIFHRGKILPCEELMDGLHAQGVAVHLIPERHRFDTAVFGHLSSLVQDLRPEVLQTNSVKSHFLARAAGLHRLQSWIAWHHGYTRPDYKMQLYNELDWWSLGAAKRVIVPCRALRDEVVKRGVPSSRVCVIPNAMPRVNRASAESVEQLRQRLRLDRNTKMVLSVGRLSSEKGQIHLIRAMRRLIARCPSQSCRLVVVGQGPDEAVLRAEIRKLSLGPVVDLLCGEDDVRPFYALADLFALPSLSEGMPNVIFEAISAGLPIIATRVGGIPEVLTDGQTATLVEPGRPEALGLAMLELLGSSDLRKRLAWNAMIDAQQEFSLEDYGRRVRELYLDVLIPSELRIKEQTSAVASRKEL